MTFGMTFEASYVYANLSSKEVFLFEVPIAVRAFTAPTPHMPHAHNPSECVIFTIFVLRLCVHGKCMNGKMR